MENNMAKYYKGEKNKDPIKYQLSDVIKYNNDDNPIIKKMIQV